MRHVSIAILLPAAGLRRALLCCVGVLGASLLLAGISAAPARARGTDPAAVGRTLVERAYRLLRRAELQFARGDKAQARGPAKEAERIFRSVLDQEPRNLQAALLGGQAATLASDRRGAAVWVERYGRLSPSGRGDPDYHFLLAFVQLLGEERPERALRSLTRMYSLNPRARPVERDNLWYRALSAFGTRLMRAEKYEEAIVQFRLGARIGRRLGKRRYQLLMLANIGAALVQADRYIEATEIFEGLVKKEQANPLWRYRLALCHANQSRFAEAVPVYRKVLDLVAQGRADPAWMPELRQADLRLGNCLRHLAEQQGTPEQTARLYGEAEKHLRRYVTLAPDDSVGHKWLGVLLFENLGKPYEALPLLKKAFALDEICEDALRYMLQIRRRYPPPAGTTNEAWQKPIAALEKDLRDGAQRRKAEKKRRVHQTGRDGCN